MTLLLVAWLTLPLAWMLGEGLHAQPLGTLSFWALFVWMWGR